MLVLLKFCWHTQIVSFSTKGARSFHIDFSLQNHVIVVAWTSSLCTWEVENVNISVKRAHPATGTPEPGVCSFC